MAQTNDFTRKQLFTISYLNLSTNERSRFRRQLNQFILTDDPSSELSRDNKAMLMAINGYISINQVIYRHIMNVIILGLNESWYCEECNKICCSSFHNHDRNHNHNTLCLNPDVVRNCVKQITPMILDICVKYITDGIGKVKELTNGIQELILMQLQSNPVPDRLESRLEDRLISTRQELTSEDIKQLAEIYGDLEAKHNTVLLITSQKYTLRILQIAFDNTMRVIDDDEETNLFYMVCDTNDEAASFIASCPYSDGYSTFYGFPSKKQIKTKKQLDRELDAYMSYKDD